MKKKIIIPTLILSVIAIAAFLILGKQQQASQNPAPVDQKAENFEELRKQRAKKIDEQEKKEITDTLVRIDESFSDTEIEKLTEEDFIEYLDEIRAVIPTNQQLQAMDSSQVHHFPVQVMEVGYRMGIIKRIMALRPEFYSEAIEFYNVCSLEGEYPTAIRALCLTNLLKEETGKINMDDYPEDVRELAKSALEL